MYTLDDYAAAKATLAEHQRKYENYSGNKPEKFRADIESAKAGDVPQRVELVS